MKWNGHWEGDILKRKYIFGFKDYIVATLWIGFIVVIVVALFFLGSFRWSL